MQVLAKSITPLPVLRREKKHVDMRPSRPSRSALLPTSGRVLFAELIYKLPVALCIAAFAAMGTSYTAAQSASTGAIAGTIMDPSGAVVPAAQVTATNTETGAARTVEADASGSHIVPFLTPGPYKVDVTATGFKVSSYTNIRVIVTETQGLNVTLEIGAAGEQITVEAGAELLQTETSSLGHVTGGDVVVGLPLVTRNYTQILALNSGVAANLTDATTIGRGSIGTMTFVVQGATYDDNNFLTDGLSANDHVSDIMSGGIAIPNPDTIAEFKVQTGLYDASNGRTSGANVNLVTKTGTNQYHGSLWEFWRNEHLNANSFFRNQAGQPRSELRQNQYGFTLGGPVVKDKLLMFGSYQGTQQKNGVGSACSSNFREPPLTNDRSAAAIHPEDVAAMVEKWRAAQVFISYYPAKAGVLDEG